jgi:hypothetical protein
MLLYCLEWNLLLRNFPGTCKLMSKFTLPVVIIFCIPSTQYVHSMWQVTCDSPWTSRECSWCVATWVLCNGADSEWPGRVALYNICPEKIFFYPFALVQHMKHCHCVHYMLSLLLSQRKTHGMFSCTQRKQNQNLFALMPPVSLHHFLISTLTFSY